MSKPELIRICPMGSSFEHVGRVNGSLQFMAYVTGDFSCRSPNRPKRCWAVLHLFKADGSHHQTLAECGGLADEGLTTAYDEFDQMLGAIEAGNPEITDIWVKPFEIIVDGVRHGLIYEMSNDGKNEWVMLEPRDIMFHGPRWDDGRFST